MCLTLSKHSSSDVTHSERNVSLVAFVIILVYVNVECCVRDTECVQYLWSVRHALIRRFEMDSRSETFYRKVIKTPSNRGEGG